MTEVIVPTTPPLATIQGVDLVRTGQWNLSSGPVTFTTGDLAAAVAAVDCPAVRNPILKLGHTDPRFDGEPAVGKVINMTLTAGGHTIVGDYTGMPGWLGDVIASAYPDRSIEGFFDWHCQLGHTHPFVITAVALLGVQHPGVGTLTSLQDVATLYGVAAAEPEPADGPGERVAVTIHARRDTMPNPRPTKVAAAVTSEDVRRAYYQNAPYAEWICEIQLEPLQLIIVDDESGKYYRLPVTVDGEDNFIFGDKVEVRIRYEDVPASGGQSGDGAAAASAGVIVFASRAESRPGEPPAGEAPTAEPGQDTVNDNPTNAAATVRPEPQDTPEPARAAGTTHKEGAAMDAAKLREALGLSPEASDDEVRAALTEQGVTPTPPADPDPESDGDPEGDSDDGGEGDEDGVADGGDSPEQQPPGQPGPAMANAAPRVPDGYVMVPKAAWNDTQAAAQEGRQAREVQRTEARERLLSDAVKAGKIIPASLATWRDHYEKDPEGTTKWLASAQQIVPIEDVGAPGGEPTENFDDIDRMFTKPVPKEA